MSIKVIDISAYQDSTPPDFKAVKGAGIEGVMIKATEGTGYVNPNFARDITAARAAGLVVGGYHFARPELNSPEDEFAYFKQRYVPMGHELYALDMESGHLGVNYLDWTLRWLRAGLREFGYHGILYTGAWFAVPHGVDNNAELSNFGLWESAYTPNMPAIIPGWHLMAMWQFTDRAQVPGIRGGVDMSCFFGTREQLLMYGRPVASPPPKPPAPPPPAPAPPAPPGTRWGTFAGVVMVDMANVRAAAGLQAQVLRTVSRGTRLGFDGYTHAAPAIADRKTGRPDDRWFHIDRTHGYGWIASALVDGNPNF